ncbi:MAG: GNAT family N-acetyltransferase [Microbacteriaceae bacterium]|nr:GNAT family N-acetyltransferase [Microbacteriaceae bacterium]MCL2795208.1 GNAT family N-acetyltransferase [Microbacteriaceae bacterium]
MTIAIREPKDSDFFPWLNLYEAYAVARGAQLTEQKALQLWMWLSDPAHVESSLIAVDEHGDLAGFALFHSFPRPLEGDTGVFIDALFVSPESSELSAGQALFTAIRDGAAQRGAVVVRWTQAEGEQLAPALSQVAGQPTTPTTFELQTAAQFA